MTIKTMTFSANRNDIKAVLFRITFVMMILLGLFGAIRTSQNIGSWQFAVSNSMSYSSSCFSLFGMSNMVLFHSFAIYFFSSFCLAIFFYFFQLTRFTNIKMSIFGSLMFVKFRKRFGLFANPTSFGYDLLRHYFLLYRKFCLEPTAIHAVVGLSYYGG